VNLRREAALRTCRRRRPREAALTGTSLRGMGSVRLQCVDLGNVRRWRPWDLGPMPPRRSSDRRGRESCSVAGAEARRPPATSKGRWPYARPMPRGRAATRRRRG